MKKVKREEILKTVAREAYVVDNIVQYVTENYDALEKSHFNGQEIVVVLEIQNEDYGYGEHNYSGVGVDREGKIWYCFSSGCSCRGECGIEGPHGHDMTTKKFVVDGNAFDLAGINVATLDKLQVDFDDY